MNHLIGSLEYFTARGEGNQAGPPQSAPPTSYDQTIQALQSAATATAAAWQRPGALEQTIDTGAGEMPGSALATMALSEMLTHSWDLAKATGQRMPADDVEVDGVLAEMKQTLKPEARQPNFGPEAQAPSGAPPIDRLAAFLGRHPYESPTGGDDMTIAAERTRTIQAYRVYIKATPQAVWDAITKPEWTTKYGYAGLVDYELRPGGKFQCTPMRV